MSAAICDVRPAGSRFEGLALLAAALLLVGVLFFYVREFGQEDKPQQLYDWQISAFDGLSGVDQAVYNALYTMQNDIPYIYEDINRFTPDNAVFHWPSVKDFQDLLLPPFYHDRSWEQNGSLQWTLFEPLSEGEMQGSVMYLGTGGKVPGQGSFLLVIGHAHAGFANTNAIVIWWNKNNQVAMPESGFQDQLILQGWRQVVPYSGDLEVKRLFGDEAEGEKGS
ncbi:MAG: hypothetical protein QM696_14430 [Steroidobacteraceae bacterium]